MEQQTGGRHSLGIVSMPVRSVRLFATQESAMTSLIPATRKPNLTPVYAVPCDTYDQMRTALQRLLKLMGGIEQFVSPAETVLLKPNLLRPAAPETAVCTHPALIEAMAQLLGEARVRPLIADSPGAGLRYHRRALNQTYRESGMEQAAANTGAQLNWDVSSQPVSFPQGKLTKRFDIITPALESDGIINLCKLKTHVFMQLTGAVKNLFGLIPGLTKPGYHAKLRDAAHFAHMLLDLAMYAAPRLSVMDAVVAMEGEGPGGGTPRKVGLLLASTDPLALDVVAGAIAGLPEKHNPLLRAAQERRLRPASIEQIELVGIALQTLQLTPLRLPSSVNQGAFVAPPWWERLAGPLVARATLPRPVVLRDRCIACGACVRACPVSAVTLPPGGTAHVNRRRCIQCYCCHEMCPKNAIKLQHHPLHRLLRPGVRS